MSTPEVKDATEFFESIGHKAEQVAPRANGEHATEEDGDQKPVEEIESLCMNCHENGTTRLLLTKIPYFREIIIMSFSCDKCGFQNNEIQAAGSVQPKGTHYELRLTDMPDFSRQVIKSDTATLKFIELDLEVPAGRGQLTNVEGILSNILDDLELGQEARKEQAPDVHDKIADIVTKGRAMLTGRSFPFRLAVDDPAGNSWIAPDLRDGVGKWAKREYVRTIEQNEALGLGDTDAAAGIGGSLGLPSLTAEGDIIPNEVYAFPASCPGCLHPCTTNMKMVDVPHFQQVILMSTVCDDCGYRSNDVKTGGAIPEKGKKITLKVTSAEDLARDILKSESCSLECPEISLTVNPGTLGGRFTTVEGLLTQIRDDLHNQIFEANGHSGTVEGGDSLIDGERERWKSFFRSVDSALKAETPFTVALVDPLACSYVQSLAEDPTNPDAQLTIEEYTRTTEEEEDLGLLDMKVEGYEQDAPK